MQNVADLGGGGGIFYHIRGIRMYAIGILTSWANFSQSVMVGNM